MSLYKKEFPDYDGDFIVPKGWFDNSYHNDVCPRAEVRVGDNVCFILWQDYVDINKRECSDGCRFVFMMEVDDECVFLYQTNDAKEVLKLCKSVWR